MLNMATVDFFECTPIIKLCIVLCVKSACEINRF